MRPNRLLRRSWARYQSRYKVRRLLAVGSFSDNILIKFIVSAALLFNSAYGLYYGSAFLFYKSVKKSEDSLLYWISVTLSGALGATTLWITISGLLR